ncbi:MAG: carboxypeptidase regulatory-like domain-containing protein [Candidatus Zixiibacteriota bacterium]|nr:MAG: carboxypeptidase regulatory-like domain-containing protein [candidate division Zixibacteria bacterium]
MPGRFTDLYIILIMLLVAGAAIVVAEGTGRITGQLFDDDTGEPIEAATVVVVGSKRGAVTDFNGRYVIGGLEPGTYTLICSDADYCTDTLKSVPVRSKTTTNAPSRLHKYEPGKPGKQTCEQWLVSEDTARAESVAGSYEPLWEAWAPITNLRGEIFLARRPPLYLAVRVDACGDTMIVTFDQNNDLIMSLIKGSVTDAESGKPIVEANVTVTESDSEVKTDMEGKFIHEELVPDCYTIEISHPDYETCTMTEVKVHSNATGISCQLNRQNK